MIDRLLSHLAPHLCCSCGTTGAVLCEDCKFNIVENAWSDCALCEKPCGPRGLCRKCIRKAPFEQVWVVGRRENELKQLINEYKFGSKRAAAVPIAELLHLRLPLLPPDTVAVGMPASAHGVRVQGFDHMQLIVRELARQRSLATAQPLRRITNRELHTMSRENRIAMKDRLFELSGVATPEKVLLLDDILTTGTTLLAAAELLKKAGAQTIYAAVVARQPFNR